MEIDFIEIIGGVKNDSMVDGKALLFSIVDVENKKIFESIVFIHPTLEPFITIESDIKIDKDVILKAIINKYTLEELRKL